LTSFVTTLDNFCEDFYRPISPFQTSFDVLSSPLE
jgi:hypothetical protein